ncbi:hypothetical protein CAL7716_080330 [Calothrix sp. PCC 7716]|nr:hypothetical protein CAL7716_080330 [Calothrix sp. PCC 7716]
MLVKITFWVVFLVWVLDILQPGYLQFYDLRNFVTMAQRVKLPALNSTAVSSTATTESKPSNSITQEAKCREAKNDFEQILNTQLVGCKSTGEN